MDVQNDHWDKVGFMFVRVKIKTIKEFQFKGWWKKSHGLKWSLDPA